MTGYKTDVTLSYSASCLPYVTSWSEERSSLTPDSWPLATVSTVVPSGSGDQYAVDELGSEDAEVTGWSEEGFSLTNDSRLPYLLCRATLSSESCDWP